MLTIACVLKTGGWCTADDVLHLRDGIRRHVTVPNNFYCLTNLNGGYPNGTPKFNSSGIVVRPLEHDLPGWWSKIELFRLPGPLLYFDLDTVLTGNIDALCEQVLELGDKVLMLRGFRRKDVASGIMGWSGDMSWVTDMFIHALCMGDHFDETNCLRKGATKRPLKGDQDWLLELFWLKDIPGYFAQDVFPGIYSYKNHLQGKDLPDDARIVCFHGRPRPADVNPVPEWLIGAQRQRC